MVDAGAHMRITNLKEVLAALTAEGQKAKAASLHGANAVAVALQTETRRNLNTVQNSTKGGHIGSTGDFPNRRTGTLSRSIAVHVRNGFGNYTFEVGPTVVYGRILEQGFANGNKYPYMAPSADNLRPRVDMIFLNAVRRYWRG
jgi:hypothetical protein